MPCPLATYPDPAPASAIPRSAIVPLASPPSSGTRTPFQRISEVTSSPSPSFSLPPSPPRTLDSPERTSAATAIPAGGPLISRKKAAPRPISVPAQKAILGVVLEKKPLPGMDLVSRPYKQPPVAPPVVVVQASSNEQTVSILASEVPHRQVDAQPTMPISKRSLASTTAQAPLPGLQIMLSRTIAYPFALGIYPPVKPARQPTQPTPPRGIPVLLGDDIAYPFADGIYPTVSGVAPVTKLKPALVENAMLSGLLDGLDRTKDRPQDSTTEPLFRFGFPYFAEADSQTPTRTYRVTSMAGRIVEFADPASRSERVYSSAGVSSVCAGLRPCARPHPQSRRGLPHQQRPALPSRRSR
jgi:hypothetical protein